MYKITFFVITIVTFLAHPYIASAGIDLPWSTTFDCAEQVEGGGSLSCDNLSWSGDWTTSSGRHEQVTASANNPAGGGGRGQRHWVGDGTNNNSGGIDIGFNTPQTGDVYMRWYMRFETGKHEAGALKVHYVWDSVGGAAACINFDGGGKLYLTKASSPERWYSGTGWGNTFYLTGTSDGTWIEFEAMFGVATGNFKMWVNGVQEVDDTGLNYGSNINRILVGSNQKDVSEGQDMYIDYDDIAISNTGYIGPVSGGGTVKDTASPSVSISSPVQGQTFAGDVTLSASASDNIGVSGVQFKIDGTDFGSEQISSPYAITLDTTVLSDGSHALTALARDAAGNQAISTAVDFTIVNASSETGAGGTPLFSESFDDTNFAANGWYDNTNLQLTTAEHTPGSTKSVEFLFNQGATTPTSGGAIRKLFNETDEIYVSYNVKYSANWVGSNQSYHPHEFMIMTNEDGTWDGMASTHLTAYIEQNALRPVLNIQDSDNIDTANIGNDLVGQTESRAVGGCNGDSDGHGNGDCYQSGQWRNVKEWLYNSAVITAGSWHKVEVYFKLNTISGGIGQQDGVMQYWLDGNLLMDYHDIVFRTGQHPGMKFNQFIIAPYIGDGSPVTQTFWVDDLIVATSTSAQSATIPPPTNLRVE